jgi:hypothetical protein
MTVRNTDLDPTEPCNTMSPTTYTYDANDRLVSSSTVVNPISVVAQPRINGYYASRPKGWAGCGVMGYAAVKVSTFLTPRPSQVPHRAGQKTEIATHAQEIGGCPERLPERLPNASRTPLFRFGPAFGDEVITPAIHAFFEGLGVLATPKSNGEHFR